MIHRRHARGSALLVAVGLVVILKVNKEGQVVLLLLLDPTLLEVN